MKSLGLRQKKSHEELIKVSMIEKMLSGKIKSGRQRKKDAARSAGSEFFQQSRKQKRRLYFCCIGGEIDVEKLSDKFQRPFLGMKGTMYAEVLHLYLNNLEEQIKLDNKYSEMIDHMIREQQRAERHRQQHRNIENKYVPSYDDLDFSAAATPRIPIRKARNESDTEYDNSKQYYTDQAMSYEDVETADENEHTRLLNPSPENIDRRQKHSRDNNDRPEIVPIRNPSFMEDELLEESLSDYWEDGGKDIFVFEFGALVFWGYEKYEISDELLSFFRVYLVKGPLSKKEFAAGEDDMAFVVSSDITSIAVSHDVLLLPLHTQVKARLAVSFAIAQSSVLNIFESRIETQTETYKNIPKVLATQGKAQLSSKQLGTMMGEVFVIRHDINLHSEILNIPDFFWKQDYLVPLYRMMTEYLEVEIRTDVVNKRIDLLRELVTLLQHQQETDHGTKLEWIVIWLIVVGVILEFWIMIKEAFHWNLDF